MLLRPVLMPILRNPLQGIADGIRNMLAELLGSSQFFAPLTHSLVLARGTGSPTFTRASTATVMGYGPTDNAADGLKLLTVAANEARFVGARRISEGVWSNTFADGSLIPAATNTGYLAEGARTNLCLQSQTFDNAAWTARSVGGAAAPTITANQAIAPDGTLTADLISGGTSYPAVEATATVAYTAAAWCFSLYAKKGTGEIVLGFSVDGGDEAAFDTATGFAGSIGANISDAGSIDEGDYWRFYAVSTRTAVAKKPIIYNGFPTASSFHVWGAQLELGSSASTYIPTTTAAVTRAADVLTYPVVVSGSNSIYAEVTPSDRENFIALVLDDGTTNNREFFLDSTVSPGLARFFVASGGATQADIEVTTLTSGVTFKAAGSVATNSAKFAVNGTLGTEDTSVTVPAASTTLHVGTNTAGAALNPLTIRNVRIWQRQLSASEMQAITA